MAKMQPPEGHHKHSTLPGKCWSSNRVLSRGLLGVALCSLAKVVMSGFKEIQRKLYKVCESI